jgi:autotransporter-associated beta strand protein
VLNPDPTKVYAFSANGSNVVLDITAAIISQWNLATGGSWASAGSWSGSGVPNASGATALFGSALASPGTVTLDGNKTVATVAFDNTNSYTISPTTTESLILANTGQAQITGTNGSHQITAPITLNSNTVVAVANSGDTISLSGVISGSGNLTKSGPGTLSLSGSNNFTGNVAISAGTLSIGTGSLGASTSLSMGASTLRWATGVTDDVSNAGSRTIQFLPGDSTWDTNGNDVIVAGNIGQSGSGNLIKVGTGNLTLSGNNTYTGTTTINGGTLTVTDDDSLGAAPGSATPNSLVINSATLGTSGAFTLSANRGVTLGSATSTVEAAAASNVVCGGIVAGSGKLNVTGTGIFDLAATNTYSGGTVINTGATLNLSAAGTPGTGQIALAGGTLSISRDSYLEDDILIDAAQTGTIDATANRVGVRALTGSGEVTLITRNGGNNAGNQGDGFRFQGNNAGFTGVVNLKSGTGTVNTFTALFNTNTGNNFDGNFSNATFQMSDFARIGGVNNSGGNTMTIGALSGDTTAILAGADYAGTQTYNIGGKGLDTTFAGVIENGSAGNANIIKSGTGKLTLTGTNTYGGTTTVNAGTLAVENASALGADTTGTTIAGGDVDAKVTITGGVTLTEPWTLAGRQGTNADSPAIVSLSGNNILSGFVSPATSGDRYNIQCDAGSLTVEGGFAPGGAVTGNRFLQIFGNGSGEWSGAIQNGTATVHLNVKSAGTWTLSGANDYTGDTLVDSGATVVLSSTGHLKFAPTSNGLSNLIYGLGTATLDGVIDIDLNAADNTDNNSWQLVDVASVTYGSNFDVPGFTKSGTTWTMVSGPSTWTFEQTSGILSVDTVPGYSSWIGTFGLSGGDAAAGFDYDKDGISNGIEYVIGGDPANANDNDKLPTLTKVPGGFEFVYRRTDLSSLDNPSVLHDADLVGTWTTAVNGVDGVTITVSDDFYGAAVDKVTVFIPSTDPKHFARLNVVIP